MVVNSSLVKCLWALNFNEYPLFFNSLVVVGFISHLAYGLINKKTAILIQEQLIELFIAHPITRCAMKRLHENRKVKLGLKF